MRNFWIHVGGSIAINEGGRYPPGSYFLGQQPTGELCGSSFWIRFNRKGTTNPHAMLLSRFPSCISIVLSFCGWSFVERYHQLRPAAEVYTAEIERSLLNVILANQAGPDADPPTIRYFAQLEGAKATPTNVVTCCESQGTRTYGALPEFVYTASKTDPDVIYVNLFVPSVHTAVGFRLVQTSDFPRSGTFSLAMATSAPLRPAAATAIQVMIRIPSWCAESAVPVVVTAADGATVRTMSGRPGSYLAVQLAATQTVSALFPMRLRLSMYNGTAPVDDFACNSVGVVRAAVEVSLPDSLFQVLLLDYSSNFLSLKRRPSVKLQWGPTLLAATYSTDPKCSRAQPATGPWAPAVTIVGVDPRVMELSDWLLPAGHDQHGDPVFAVKGTSGCILFRYYYTMQNESFSVYPNFLTTAGLDQRGTCAVTSERAHRCFPGTPNQHTSFVFCVELVC